MAAGTDVAAATSFAGHILVDVPAVDPAFRFAEIAGALASIVQESPPRFAVGILGGWGTGKSTLMEAMVDRMDRRKVLVVPFNAWRYEREPHLMVPLLDSVRGGLDGWARAHRGVERTTTLSVARRVGTVVRALSRGVSGEIGLPGAMLKIDPGPALDELAALRAGPPDVAHASQSLYHAAFQELASAFADLDKKAKLSRIVIFVDDLDRCLPPSALTVLESMKLFFDLPGFVFVVGLDERVISRAVAAKFADGLAGQGDTAVLEREYLKKIFQVPYRLPPMATAQLDELLGWLDLHAPLGDAQRTDLRTRARPYLSYVAELGQVNPREVKRFVNAYTLQRMVRPDLDPEVLLALQTIDFRGSWDEDWERLYDVIVAEPAVFADTLQLYRQGSVEALRNLWPQLGVLPAQLARFLLSPQAEPLAKAQDLERYVSSLQTASPVPTWLHDAVKAIGELRQLVRDTPGGLPVGSTQAQSVVALSSDLLGRLDGLRSIAPSESSRLQVHVESIRSASMALVPQAGQGPNSSADPVSNELVWNSWRESCQRSINELQEELRLIRQDFSLRS